MDARIAYTRTPPAGDRHAPSNDPISGDQNAMWLTIMPPPQSLSALNGGDVKRQMRERLTGIVTRPTSNPNGQRVKYTQLVQAILNAAGRRDEEGLLAGAEWLPSQVDATMTEDIARADSAKEAGVRNPAEDPRGQARLYGRELLREADDKTMALTMGMRFATAAARAKVQSALTGLVKAADLEAMVFFTSGKVGLEYQSLQLDWREATNYHEADRPRVLRQRISEYTGIPQSAILLSAEECSNGFRVAAGTKDQEIHRASFWVPRGNDTTLANSQLASTGRLKTLYLPPQPCRGCGAAFTTAPSRRCKDCYKRQSEHDVMVDGDPLKAAYRVSESFCFSCFQHVGREHFTLKQCTMRAKPKPCMVCSGRHNTVNCAKLRPNWLTVTPSKDSRQQAAAPKTILQRPHGQLTWAGAVNRSHGQAAAPPAMAAYRPAAPPQQPPTQQAWAEHSAPIPQGTGPARSASAPAEVTRADLDAAIRRTTDDTAHKIEAALRPFAEKMAQLMTQLTTLLTAQAKAPLNGSAPHAVIPPAQPSPPTTPRVSSFALQQQRPQQNQQQSAAVSSHQAQPRSVGPRAPVIPMPPAQPGPRAGGLQAAAAQPRDSKDELIEVLREQNRALQAQVAKLSESVALLLKKIDALAAAAPQAQAPARPRPVAVAIRANYPRPVAGRVDNPHKKGARAAGPADASPPRPSAAEDGAVEALSSPPRKHAAWQQPIQRIAAADDAPASSQMPLYDALLELEQQQQEALRHRQEQELEQLRLAHQQEAASNAMLGEALRATANQHTAALNAEDEEDAAPQQQSNV